MHLNRTIADFKSPPCGEQIKIRYSFKVAVIHLLSEHVVFYFCELALFHDKPSLEVSAQSEEGMATGISAPK